ncbi:sensor histidine kinase [Catellatospora citrea]|uniref:histidine kinase n=1 Tax=Catellatospora citrea TaxID=53366 RepID=A0A8J3NZZ3_9ACTN|nr:sensor histidine kinase [Catellatospora citrea]RKE12161.1 sensor histidine kinase regulating citrate/malate metabolism [Catellatospora citrea]GIF98875.1 ATPase [Catellatospora citrea]
MRRQFSLARQLLLFQLGIVLLAVGAVAAVSMAEAQAAFYNDEGGKLRSIAESLAWNDTIRQGMGPDVWYDSLAAAAETARGANGVSFVVLTDAEGRLLTGPDAGRLADLGDSDGLAGKGWHGEVLTPARVLEAHAPVIDPGNGKVLGLVVAGQTYPSWPQLLAEATPDLLTYLLLGSALGIGGSMLLVRRVKRQTMGLEPREIAGLVEHREAMLHGLKEGLLALDTSGRITLANDEAVRLLDLPGDVTGKPLPGLGVPDDLVQLLTSGGGEPDHVVLFQSRVLVLNRMPVLVHGRTVGSVTTLRDRTELTSLERELDLSRHATDTLRAQAHEFTNRLHTISGLIQLGQYDDAVNFIIRAGQAQEDLSHRVQSRIADPALAALLIAKASAAAEQRVELSVDDASQLSPQPDGQLVADLVTVVGNLVDNGIDAAPAGGWVRVLIRQDPAEVEVRVDDSGPGVANELAQTVFTRGYSTKDSERRGLGLALISQICTARGGSVSVEGAAFTARLPRQRERS